MKYTKCDFLSKVWVRPPGWTWCVGSKGQIATFSEHCYVAYQIKGNQECSKMLTNVLPANTYPRIPPPPGDGVKSSKFNFFKHFDLTHTPSIWVWLKSDIDIVQNLIVFFLITSENYFIVI